MAQEVKKNAEIEKVYEVFEDYIKASPYIDWLWSDKLGYILMEISLEYREIMESRIITDAENLCLIMFHEIADDVLEMTQNDHIPQEADPLEKAEIKKRLKPYIDRLPQYTYLCEKLFEE